MNEELVTQWILEEMRANGIVDKVHETHMFYGDRHDFIVEVKVFPVRKNVPFRETGADFGPEYETRGYN